MKKISIIIILMTLVGATLFYLLLQNIKLIPTGFAVEESLTKAVCNTANYCEDYYIECSQNNTLSMTPTGNAVQFPKSWRDPRTREEIEKMC